MKPLDESEINASILFNAKLNGFENAEDACPAFAGTAQDGQKVVESIDSSKPTLCTDGTKCVKTETHVRYQKGYKNELLLVCLRS